MSSRVSPESYASLAAVDRTVIASSESAGWTSLLVDHHAVRPHEQVVEIPATPDQTIVVGAHGAQELEVVTHGRSRRAVYGAGTVGLTAGGQADPLRRHRVAGFETFVKTNIYVPAATVSGVRELVGPTRSPDQPLRVLAVHDRTVVGVAHALVEAMSRGVPDLYAEAAAQWLVTHLLSTGGPPRRPSALGRHYPNATRARVDGVLDLIHAAYAEPLSLDRLAEEARISKYHLSRLFRRATGSTPHAYLVRIRLEAATRMLVGTELPVAQIARRCGFVRAAHFGAAFGRHYGMSPTAYRRRTAA